LRVLLTGATGQIGSELAQFLVHHDVVAPRRDQCDLANPGSVRDSIAVARPDLIVNAAAYTAVDRAESEATLAHSINADAPAVMADEARRRGIALIHFSTDYVFDGESRAPYREQDPARPLNVYGQTKLAGEQAVVGSGCIHLILRTSWVYSRHGRNFLLTIERLARERDQLRVVDDQIGIPNWSRDLARAAVRIAERPREELSQKAGIYHLTSRGRTSWHGFATAIVDSMHLEKRPAVMPIATSEYPTPARRPAFTVLDGARLEEAFAVGMPRWEDGLAACQTAFRVS
jgi:dTDP-4-dehydrorhamnose reductase